MRDLLASPLFSTAVPAFREHARRLHEADVVHLSAPACLSGVLAMGQLEAACLDLGIKYSRRFFPAKHHLPRDEQVSHPSPKTGLSIVLDVEEETWEENELKEHEWIQIVPIKTRLEMGSKHRLHSGALDGVIQAAALAASLAPNGRRVRKLRPYIGTGLWLRGALDTSFDPVHTAVVQHLKDEGTVRMVSLPEVTNPTTDMIPGLSERQLKRLSRVWSTMDVDQRTQALSELVLPCMANSSLSTPRLEELIWHRMLVGDQPQDIASQLYGVKQMWPEGHEASNVFASKLLDTWLSTGELILS